MTIAIHQPNYAPWCGYFAKMAHCDVFVFLDDAEMSKGSYTPRCQIRNGPVAQWLSVPTTFSLGQKINEVRCANAKWPQQHLKTFQASYGRCPFFAEIMGLLEPVYATAGAFLSPFNIELIRVIAQYLGLSCRFVLASTLGTDARSDDRLIEIVRQLGGDSYLSGKGGQNYQDPRKFADAGIELVVRSYSPIAYAQRHGPFVAGLSLLDGLFHLGANTKSLLHYQASSVPVAASELYAKG